MTVNPLGKLSRSQLRDLENFAAETKTDAVAIAAAVIEVAAPDVVKEWVRQTLPVQNLRVPPAEIGQVIDRAKRRGKP